MNSARSTFEKNSGSWVLVAVQDAREEAVRVK